MISDRLKKLRNEKGLTQQQVASDLGVSQPNYRRWEAGERKPKQTTLEKLADYYQVSVNYLTGNTELRDIEFFTNYDSYLKDIHIQSFELGKLLNSNIELLINSITEQKKSGNLTDAEYRQLLNKVIDNTLHLFDKVAKEEMKKGLTDYINRLSENFLDNKN